MGKKKKTITIDYDAAIINKEKQLTQFLKVAWVYQAYVYPPPSNGSIQWGTFEHALL